MIRSGASYFKVATTKFPVPLTFAKSSSQRSQAPPRIFLLLRSPYASK
jgi:hypothetical protein